MTVEPIRDKAKIKQMYQLLKGRDEKYALLFKFGLNTGLR
ncbi:MAG TPA: recombinase XerD, partial [Clostridiales bacterium]|nr:recombinase XerD [Clostridiales bacterium]